MKPVEVKNALRKNHFTEHVTKVEVEHMEIERPRKIPIHFSEMLRDILQRRILKNENYSLRAFARDIGLSSGNLSDILNQKASLSISRAEVVSLKLNLPLEDQNLFVALVELVKVVGFRNDDAWIGARLEIPVDMVRTMINKLIRVKLLEEVDGVLHQTYDFFVSPSGTPSHAAKEFHHQILEQASNALNFQKIEDRD